MRKLIILSVLAMSLLVAPLANAQSQTVLDRIDQAMEHLTGWLNLSTPITRQVQYWRWEEQVYPDSGFGCGVAGQTYPAEPNRAFNIFITYQDVDYNYRVSFDGGLLVLCGAGDVPLYRSDDPSLAPQPQPTVAAPTTTLNPDFNAWVYMAGQQQLYLLNETGPVANFPRPTLTNENAVDGPLAMAMSRDGRYLIQVVELNSNVQALTIFDLESGQQRIIPAATDESIFLGSSFDWDYSSSSVTTITPLVTNVGSTQVAVGFANATDPSVNEWRLAIIDLASGTILNQLNAADLPSIIQGSDQALTDALNSPSSFRARPVMFDAQGGIHFHLIFQFTGGALEYPSVVWYPQAGTAAPSPFVSVNMNIRPAGTTVFNVYDPNLPAAPQTGMLPSFNALTQADYLTVTPNERYIFGGSNDPIYDPRWADDTNLVLYRVETDPDTNASAFYARETASDNAFILPGKGVGVPGGLLAVGEGTSGPLISFFDDTSASLPIWEAPPQNGAPIFVWTNHFDEDLSLTTLFDGQDLQSTVPVVTPAPVVDTSCGDQPSIVQVGIIARSTIDDGSPLNVRNAPNTTTAAVILEIPEDTRFDIIGGPECSDGYTWWQVRLQDGVVGWVAESGSEFYFIEPAP